MIRKLIFISLLLAGCLLSAQDLTPWQYVRHSAVDVNGFVHVRFNGSQEILDNYEFYNWQNSAWTETPLTNPETFVYEALLPAVSGQILKYRLRTSYDYMGETITAVNPAFLSSDSFPPDLNALGYIADDPVGDSINVYHPNLDITGNWFGYTDTKLYCAMSNASNLFPTMNSFTSYNLYFAGLASTTTAVADSSVYAMIYTFNIPGVISPGLYKLGINLADTTVVYQYLGPIQSVVSGGKLYLSCNISDLTADPGFGTWPPEFNSLGFMSGSIKIDIDSTTFTPSFGIGDLSGIAQLVFENHNYTVGINALPVLSDFNVQSVGAALRITCTYTDANHDFPLYCKGWFTHDELPAEVDFVATSLDFSQPVIMEAVLNAPSFTDGIVWVSDNNFEFNTYMIPGTAVEDETMPSAPTVKIFPNPFNPAAGLLNVKIASVKTEPLTGYIYNLKGQCVRQLNGSGSLSWDGMTDSQVPAQNGLYLVKVKHDTGTLTQKIILLR